MSSQNKTLLLNHKLVDIFLSPHGHSSQIPGSLASTTSTREVFTKSGGSNAALHVPDAAALKASEAKNLPQGQRGG